MRFAVIGGGIAGLSAAWELRDFGDVTLFEPGHLGGCIRTSRLDGGMVEDGPDAFVARVPDAIDLCEEVGLGADLVAPAVGRSAIWSAGRLRMIPENLVLGVPRGITPLLRTGLLSPGGIARASLDLVLPRRGDPTSMTVRELVVGRFGPQVADRLVDPLIGGIHAGWTGNLGAVEVAPQLVAAAQTSRSLVRGLRSLPPPADAPMFLAPRAGLRQMVEALASLLGASGVRFVRAPARRIAPQPEGGLKVDPDEDSFDGVVVAVPAATAADLLTDSDQVGSLKSIPTASVIVAAMAVPGLSLPEGVNGFLVPRSEGRLMTACSFASNKWPHWSDERTPSVRVSAGRFDQRDVLEMEDGDLTERLVTELEAALATDVSPAAVTVNRWPDSFPQYRRGHLQLVDSIEAGLRRTHPGLALAGASYRGSGIPACIASGRRAAALVSEGARAHRAR